MNDSDSAVYSPAWLHFTFAYYSIRILFIFSAIQYATIQRHYWSTVGISFVTFVYSYLCRLVAGGIPEGHFTHVFVDEAGHAVETECLVSLAGKENKQHKVFYNCIELVLCVGWFLLSVK